MCDKLKLWLLFAISLVLLDMPVLAQTPSANAYVGSFNGNAGPSTNFPWMTGLTNLQAGAMVGVISSNALNGVNGRGLTNLPILLTNYYGTTGTNSITILTNTLGQLWISNYVNTSGGGGSSTNGITNAIYTNYFGPIPGVLVYTNNQTVIVLMTNVLAAGAGSIENFIPGTSPLGLYNSPVLTNGQGNLAINPNSVANSQLSGIDCDGTNIYCFFNRGLACMTFANWFSGTPTYLYTNFSYPTNGTGLGAGWTGCGGKCGTNSVYNVNYVWYVVNNFTNVDFTRTYDTLLLQFSYDLQTLVKTWDLSNTSSLNMEDVVMDFPSPGLATFSLFVTNNTTNYYVYNMNNWTSNGVLTFNQPIYTGGGMARNKADGNIYVNGLAYIDGQAFPTNLIGFYESCNPFYGMGGANSSEPSSPPNGNGQVCGYYQINPTNGNVKYILQPYSGALGGYGSPFFIWTNGQPYNGNVMWATWNYTIGNTQPYPYYSTTFAGVTNNCIAYNLQSVPTNFIQSSTAGLLQGNNAYFDNIWTGGINVNPNAPTNVASTTITPTSGLAVYGNVVLPSLGTGINTPYITMPNSGSLSSATNTIGVQSGVLTLNDVGDNISLQISGVGILDMFPGGSFNIGPGGTDFETFQMSAASNINFTGTMTMKDPALSGTNMVFNRAGITLKGGIYAGNGSGLTNINLSGNSTNASLLFHTNWPSVAFATVETNITGRILRCWYQGSAGVSAAAANSYGIYVFDSVGSFIDPPIIVPCPLGTGLGPSTNTSYFEVPVNGYWTVTNFSGAGYVTNWGHG